MKKVFVLTIADHYNYIAIAENREDRNPKEIFASYYWLLGTKLQPIGQCKERDKLEKEVLKWINKNGLIYS
jgi:hypothetical protein